MIALFVQTLLLMGAAYFVGAAVACLVRRSFHSAARPEPAAARPVEPLPEVMQRAAGPARFGAQLGAGAGAPRSRRRCRLAVRRSAGPAQDLKRIRLIDADARGRPQQARRSPLRADRGLDAARRQARRARRSASATASTGRTGSSRRRCWPRAASPTMPRARARGEIAKAAPTPDEGEPRTGAGGCATCPDDPARVDRRRRRRGRRASRWPPRRRLAAAMPAPDSARRLRARGLCRAASGRALRPRRKLHPPRCREPAVPIRPAAPATRDNLQRISGIDARGREALDRAGRHPLLADRALVAGRRGALRASCSARADASAARTGSSRRRS